MTELKVMPVEICGAMGKMYYSASDFRHRFSGYREPSMLMIADRALSELEAARSKDLETHEKNLPAMEMNKQIREQITALNTAIQMPDGWSERDPNSRARIPKRISHRAGWRQDLDKHVLVADDFDNATSNYERLKVEYTKYREAALRDDEQKKVAAQRAENERLAKRKADLEFVQICQRYELPLESEWDDVLDALRKRNQRLDLAIAMLDVRGAWNDGCGAVNSALCRFTIQTDEDKDIANDVLGCTHDFEDGRVFRDTNWSYDRLFASVEDRQLVADTMTAHQQCSRD